MENRHCPFCGFNLLKNRWLTDSKGNQCALFVDSYSPCKMEIKKETPNWNGCPLDNPKHKKN